MRATSWSRCDCDGSELQSSRKKRGSAKDGVRRWLVVKQSKVVSMGCRSARREGSKSHVACRRKGKDLSRASSNAKVCKAAAAQLDGRDDDSCDPGDRQKSKASRLWLGG